MRMALVLIAGCVLCAPAARAAIPDQDWVGTIACGTIPGVLRIPLRQPFRLEVRGGVARYQRNVRIADTSNDSGYREVGQGLVRPDGALSLTGGAVLQLSSYRSEFAGVLAARQAHFTGVQHWQFNHRPSYDRPCSLDLHRQE